MGKVENDEIFTEAAIRELWEETGLNSFLAENKPIILKNDNDDNIAFVFLNIPNEEEPFMTDHKRQQTFYWMKFSEIPTESFQKTDKEFVEIMAKPKYLWHGSPNRYEILNPNQASDFLNSAGNLVGVYATPKKESAITFAMGNKPDSQGKVTKFMKGDKNIMMVFIHGSPNWGSTGYLHKLSYEGFKEVCNGQFVCTTHVIPLEIIEIKVDDYKHLSRNATLEEDRIFRETGKI